MEEILIVILSLTPSQDEVAMITGTTPHNCLEEEVGVVALEWGMDLEVEVEWDSLLILQLAMGARREESLEWAEPHLLVGHLQIMTSRMPTDRLLLGIKLLIIGILAMITRML